jgi:hypothetical protein
MLFLKIWPEELWRKNMKIGRHKAALWTENKHRSSWTRNRRNNCLTSRKNSGSHLSSPTLYGVCMAASLTSPSVIWPEEEGGLFLQNVCYHLQDHNAPRPRALSLTFSSVTLHDGSECLCVGEHSVLPGNCVELQGLSQPTPCPSTVWLESVCPDPSARPLSETMMKSKTLLQPSIVSTWA